MQWQKGIEREESGEAEFPDFRYGIADAKNTVRVMREAPVVIVVLNTNGKSPFIPVKEDGRIVEQCDALSIGASIQNMLLRAQELGLGTLWIANTCFAYRNWKRILIQQIRLSVPLRWGIQMKRQGRDLAKDRRNNGQNAFSC